MALSKSYDETVTVRLLNDGDRCTEDEYYAFEENSEERWEFFSDRSVLGDPLTTGVIRAMAGGSFEHSRIAGNLITALNIALRGTGNQMCGALSSDLKIRTAEGRNTYPDVSVVCGPPHYHRSRRDTVTNPILVAEVLSPSTAAYDRSEKSLSYQSIPSLEQILLIDAVSATVEVLSRIQGGWETQTITGLASRLALSALNIEIALADVYYLVAFDA